jgi:putative DNA methylase
MTHKKKLIEVALPLDAINRESAREKNPFLKGHPRSLHVWWARRPLAACRAVLWASLVDDPSAHPDRFPTEEDQELERDRLFRILEELVRWENSNNQSVLAAARAEILASTDGDPPPVLDPFCGGGSIPMEAQRLGLQAFASDLNPVAVLITKALIEIPPKFARRPPVHPQEGRFDVEAWQGAAGLAEDVRYYGEWMRSEAEQRIGHLYPKANLPDGSEATVIAWLWARTVSCPNPACGATMPLVRSFALSTKKGREAWVEPIVDPAAKTVEFRIGTGDGPVPDPTKIGRGAKFRCLVCGQVTTDRQVKAEGAAGRMSARLLAMVAEGNRTRVYLAPNPEHETVAFSSEPTWSPDEGLPDNPRWFSPPEFGMKRIGDLFSDRQLIALTTFSDLVGEAREQVVADAIAAGLPDNGMHLDDGGTGPRAYAEAVATYLALVVSRMADFMNSICSWDAGNANLRQLFARQAIPMAWDFAESNPLGGVVNLAGLVGTASSAIAGLPADTAGTARQLDAANAVDGAPHSVVATDPPYYDNIGYADLSDFFYVWLRRSLRDTYPDLFATLLTPKAEELVATPYRFGGSRKEAEHHFESGLGEAFIRIRKAGNPDIPTTVFYAFKQAEAEGDGGIASTGWETMLKALLDSGLGITGTWPMRTEQQQRAVASGTSALASSIVLVCRPKPADATLSTRKDLLAALRAELPDALRRLQHGNIAPVDLAQASIGPGMAVFSRYSKVKEADGSDMSVRSALALINQVLDEILAEQEGDFDAETRWAVFWYEQFGLDEGEFGRADDLARARNTAVNALVDAGIVTSRGGKVRLLDRIALPLDWDPTSDRHLSVWEITQHLVRALDQSEQQAGDLLRQVGGLGETARELAYRLYVISDRKGWAKEALAYNGLVVAWPTLVGLASAERAGQLELGG